MPHKRNPITTERITGLARVLRGNAQAAIENVALWHERDISHSGAERVILPDSTILLDYMQTLAIRVVSRPRRPRRPHAREPRPHARRAVQPARAAGARRERHDARRGLPDRPGGRPARLGHRHAAARAARRARPRHRPRRGLRPLALHAPRRARSSRGSTRSPEGSASVRCSRLVAAKGLLYGRPCGSRDRSDHRCARGAVARCLPDVLGAGSRLPRRT